MLRRSWLYFAGASAAWTIGSVFWFYYQVLDPPLPSPSAGDFFYLSAIVLAAAGLLTFPIGTRETGDRARLFLDGLSIACSLLFVSYLLVLEEVFANLGSGLAAVVFAAYPLGDVLLGSLAILLLSRSADRWRLDLILLGCGLLIYAIGDTAFALQGARGEFRAGTPLDLAWVGGLLLIGLAALTSSSTRSAEGGKLRPAGTSGLGAVLVHGTMGLAFAVGAFVGVHGWIDVVLGAPLLVLFAVRQTVLAADNHALREDLESRVADRTAELERLARHHERILDAVGEGIYGVDAEGRITFVNPAAAQLLGSPGPHRSAIVRGLAVKFSGWPAPSPATLTEKQMSRVETAAAFCGDVVTDGWQDAVASRAVDCLKRRTWNRLFGRRRDGDCKAIAAMAKALLDGKEKPHDLVGEASPSFPDSSILKS